MERKLKQPIHVGQTIWDYLVLQIYAGISWWVAGNFYEFYAFECIFLGIQSVCVVKSINRVWNSLSDFIPARAAFAAATSAPHVVVCSTDYLLSGCSTWLKWKKNVEKSRMPETKWHMAKPMYIPYTFTVNAKWKLDMVFSNSKFQPIGEHLCVWLCVCIWQL